MHLCGRIALVAKFLFMRFRLLHNTLRWTIFPGRKTCTSHETRISKCFFILVTKSCAHSGESVLVSSTAPGVIQIIALGLHTRHFLQTRLPSLKVMFPLLPLSFPRTCHPSPFLFCCKTLSAIICVEGHIYVLVRLTSLRLLTRNFGLWSTQRRTLTAISMTNSEPREHWRSSRFCASIGHSTNVGIPWTDDRLGTSCGNSRQLCLSHQTTYQPSSKFVLSTW